MQEGLLSVCVCVCVSVSPSVCLFSGRISVQTSGISLTMILSRKCSSGQFFDRDDTPSLPVHGAGVEVHNVALV